MLNTLDKDGSLEGLDLQLAKKSQNAALFHC